MTTQECAYCGTSSGLRIAGTDCNGRPDDFICAECFTGTDTGPCFDDLPVAPPKTLLTYRHVWTERDRDGDMQYQYYCTWSDGSEGMCVSLPWGRLGDAVELPMDSVRQLDAVDRSLAAMKAEHDEGRVGDTPIIPDAPVNLLDAVEAYRASEQRQAAE